MAELRKLGARSVPIVSRGARFVFAQVISDVVDFLDLPDDTAPELAPADLASKARPHPGGRSSAHPPDAR